MRGNKEDLNKLKGELATGRLNSTGLRIQWEISEAESCIARGESDEATLDEKVGVDSKAKLADIDRTQGLRIVFFCSQL
jgi:hypothetical protein